MSMFNPQVGAVTGTNVQSSQGANVRAGARAGVALRGAMIRERRGQFQEQMDQNQEQFNTAMGVQQSQFDKTMKFQKNQQQYAEKQAEKAQKVARIGTTIEVAKMGMSMANEYDIDLMENMGFGGGDDGVSTEGSAQSAVGDQDFMGVRGRQYESDIGSEMSMGEPGEYSGGESWWSQHGGTATGALVGGGLGGIMGANLSQAIFGDGKTQSTAGGMVGGAFGGWSSTGSAWGGVGGAAVGGLLGYLLG